MRFVHKKKCTPNWLAFQGHGERQGEIPVMNKNLLRRLARLERWTPPEGPRWPTMVWMMNPMDEGARAALAPGERIVDDWYRDLYGVVWARERITTDPSDPGRRCERGGHLLDVIRELHETCELRESGGCGTCSGLNLDAEASNQEKRERDQDRPDRSLRKSKLPKGRAFH
jgi:hypothetical protein